MSSTINTQQQIPTATGQSLSAQPGQAMEKTNVGQPTSAAESKARLRAEDDSVADASSSKRAKEISAQGPQDVSAASISKMMTATGAAGLGSSLPELPSNKIANPAGAARDAAAALPGLNFTGIMAYSAIAASQMMREAGEKSFDAQSKAHQVSQLGQMNAQMDSALQAAKKAQADKGTAVLTFMGSAAGAFASYSAAARGSRGPKHGNRAEQVDAPAIRSVSQTQKASQDSVETSRAERAKAKSARSQAGKEEEEKRVETESILSSNESDKLKKREAEREQTETIKNNNEKGEDLINKERGFHNDDGAHRAGIYAASAGAGQLVTSATEAANQNLFFGKDSHDAEVAGKFDDVLSTMNKMSEETFKTGKEKAQKMIDDAISGLKQHFDLVKSANDRIG